MADSRSASSFTVKVTYPASGAQRCGRALPSVNTRSWSALANYLKDKDAALEMLRPVFDRIGTGVINHAKVDPDFDIIRDDPRFKEMLEAAERRLETQTNRDPFGSTPLRSG